MGVIFGEAVVSADGETATNQCLMCIVIDPQLS